MKRSTQSIISVFSRCNHNCGLCGPVTIRVKRGVCEKAYPLSEMDSEKRNWQNISKKLSKDVQIAERSLGNDEEVK